LLEGIFVESYGARTPLNGVASITSSDARTLLISPWDANVIPGIQKALTEAQLGVMPTVDGKNIRLSFPMLNEEMRTKSVKMLHAKAEEARIRLRRSRDEALSQIQKEKKEGNLAEDEFYQGKEGLDKKIEAVNTDLAERVKGKETEIMTI
jgi:ribosome recycling factor